MAFAAAAIPAMAEEQSPSADALFAQGKFSEAASAYEEVLARSPKDAGALAGLARIRQYEGHDTESTRLAREALAITQDNPVAQMVMREARRREDMFGSDFYKISAPNDEVSIKFAVTDPLPVVQVKLNGKLDANFLIDTGAPNIILAKDKAEALGLEIEEAGEGVFAGGLRRKVERTLLPELELGPVKIANVPAGVMPSAGALPGLRFDGIIGMGLMEHFLSTLDYCSGALVLAPRDSSASFERAAQELGANIVPMWFVGDHFPFVRAHIGSGSQGLFHVDTGLAGGGLIATKATLDAAGVTIDESNKRTGMGGGGPVTVIPFQASATLGSMTVKDVGGMYQPGGNQYRIFPFAVSGTLSHGFFRQSKLTLDFEAMRLVNSKVRLT